MSIRSIIAIGGVSTAGKSTLTELISVELGIPILRRFTTRLSRGSADRLHYHHVSVSEFRSLERNGHFIATRNWSDAYYGLSWAEVDKHSKNPFLLLDNIFNPEELKGALKILNYELISFQICFTDIFNFYESLRERFKDEEAFKQRRSSSLLLNDEAKNYDFLVLRGQPADETAKMVSSFLKNDCPTSNLERYPLIVEALHHNLYRLY